MRWILLIFCMSFALPLHAQFGVGAALTGAHVAEGQGSQTPSAWLYGPTFNLQYEHGHFFRLGLDLRVSLLNGSEIATRSITVGPRVSVRVPLAHSRLYGEVLIGVMDNRPAANSPRTGHLDGVLAVGLEHTILPHIDWRVLEYSYADVGPFFSEDTRNQLSTGLILRF